MRSLKDAVYGVAVGDAMGLPVQFEARDSYNVRRHALGGIKRILNSVLLPS